MLTAMTGLYSPVPYFALMLLIALFASTPLFSAVDESWHGKSLRTPTLDGLRGLLALGVFFHHAAITHYYLLTKTWELPPSVFYTQLGQASVSLFFMITGYLFWGKAIQTQGRLPWIALYIGRVFRIGPLYLLAIACMLFVVASASHFVLREPLTNLIDDTQGLALLGYLAIGPINGYPHPDLILAGVTWTLHYEWTFYLLLLPIAALIAQIPKGHGWFSVLGYLLCLFLVHYTYQSQYSVVLATFFAGMASASVQHRYSFNLKPNGLIPSVVLGLLALALLFFQTAYDLVPIAILTLGFFLVSSGCSFFGLLTARPLRRLGEISYGIYILQGIALYSTFSYAPLRQFALGPVLHYWTVAGIACLALVSTALLAHLVVEVPCIKLGRYLTARINNRSIAKAAVLPAL